MNDGLGRTWKKIFMVCFKLHFQYFPGRTEENCGKLVKIVTLQAKN
jgi:hypothetical protein